MKPIDVGVGVGYIAFGDGAIWTANYMDGTVSRIDPRTNAVTARVPVGPPQALAVGEGSAWVGVAGAAREGALPSFACGEVASGGGEPDVVIASDLPLRGPESTGPRVMADAIRSVLERHEFRAGKYSVGYASCDDSTTQSGSFALRKCAANATGYAHAEQLVAVIGPYNSGCSNIEIPILNRAPGGPLAMISPSNTHPGLTRPGPDGLPPAVPGQPEIFYPMGVRNYVRLAPRDDLQGTAQALLAKQLGLDSVYLLHDGDYWKAVTRHSLPRRPAVRAEIAGGMLSTRGRRASRHSRTRSRSRAHRASCSAPRGRRRRRPGAEGLRARLGPRVPIMAAERALLRSPMCSRRVGRAARGLYVMTPDLLAGPGRTPAARRIAADRRRTMSLCPAGRAGRGGGPEGDRPFGRDAGRGAQRAPGGRGERRMLGDFRSTATATSRPPSSRCSA